MKEYVYLDSELVNSYLAQIDEGILTKLITGQSETNSSQEDGGEEEIKTIKGNIGLKGIVNGGADYSQKEIDKFSSVYSKTNNELIETALADYSVDVLINKLSEKEKLKDLDKDWNDGDLVFYKNNFRIFNFDTLRDSVQQDNIENILVPDNKLDEAYVELEKISKTPQLRIKHKEKIAKLETFIKENDSYGNFRHVFRFANYSSVLFPETVLFKVGHTLLFCSKNSIRINTPLLVMLSQTERPLRVLGIVLTKRTKSLEPEPGVQLPSDVVAAESPAVLTDIMLSKFKLVSEGDYYIRPIAIYFDQE